MTREEIKQRLTEIIVDLLGVEPEIVTEDANLRDDFCADSLDAVELIMKMERGFDIFIPDAEGEKVQTVQQAIDLVQRKLSEQ